MALKHAPIKMNQNGVVDRLELIIGLIDMEHPSPNLSTVETMLENIGMAGQKELTFTEFKTLYKSEVRFSFSRNVSKLLSSLSFTVSQMLAGENAAAEENTPHFDAAGAPRGKPIFDDFQKFYTMKEQIGSGAYSTVYLATHKETGEDFAVKIVGKDNVHSSEDIDGLFEEVGILQQIDHKHVMRLNAFYEDDQSYTMVTELVVGGELFDRVVQLQHYSEKEARDLTETLLKSLHFLHSSGIVHRDLKPENILLACKSDDTNIKLADFGFAKHLSERLDTVCGTPDYVRSSSKACHSFIIAISAPRRVPS